ncbi:hypothetical protein B0J12DRAFT_71047 [Macrophomina phaseolina]|uniref:Amidohydrolase 1 n=1 Tax=Macrophomina phaseolina TaxID=35725 RepID=A0ABQ8GDT8_9PEZI|nr:hypothetical protein B0J12DRAFT_71047 [Macrophomina phaseolina]
MEVKLGVLREGALADVVVWDALAPSMVRAARADPVAAVVMMHAGTGDVDVEDGGLEGLMGEGSVSGIVGGRERLGWRDVAREVEASREALLEREREEMGEVCDYEGMVRGLNSAFGVDEERVVDCSVL